MRPTVSEPASDARVAAIAFDELQRSDPRWPYVPGAVSEGLSGVAALLGWADGQRGPLGRVVKPGDKVLVKPNFVLHANEGAGGIEPLVTHPTVIQAVVEGVLRAGPATVLVGDAPLQSCDFTQLLAVTRLDDWASRLAAEDSRFLGIRDFRRTTCVIRHGVRMAEEDQQPKERFVLFDLAHDSLLESVTGTRTGPFGAFRVTWYDPRLLARTHQPGRHQYLVARDILDADVIINLPKLKTHKKAGITCALKNVVGINGNKEFLPHHRVGGSGNGGDCYPGSDSVKRVLEFVADRQNLNSSYSLQFFWRNLAVLLHCVSRVYSDRVGYDGSWHGNDTIWRTCLDLNRILLYGRPDGTMAEEPQRRVIHLVDAIVAGHGDGPLAPDPLALGLMLAGSNAAAVDWVGAGILDYVPERVHLVREAFGRFRWPVAGFTSEAVRIVTPDHDVVGVRRVQHRVRHPIGWRSASASGDSELSVPGFNTSPRVQPDDG
jgi:uncharacterized protein (DUF362 family)